MSAVPTVCKVFILDMMNRWVVNSSNTALLMARSIESVTVIRGVMRAGCVCEPLSPANPAIRTIHRLPPCTSP